VLPLLLRHIELAPAQVTIIAADTDGIEIAREHGIKHLVEPLTKKNFEGVLDQHLGEGGFLLNVSVEVESLALIKYCRKRRVLTSTP
jgi:homospermidine synthase